MKTQAAADLIRTATKRLQNRAANRKNVGYVGGHNSGNLGDEFMFEALCDALGHCNVETLETPRVERLLEKIGLSGGAYFSHYVLGGGTLINPIWEGKVRKLIDQGVPFHALGSGVGSSGKEQSGRVEACGWKDILDKFKTVGVRGPISAARLKEIGVDSDVVGDLALLRCQTVAHPRTEKKRIAINVLYDELTHITLMAAMEKVLRACDDGKISIEAWVVNAEDGEVTAKVLSQHDADTFHILTYEDLKKRAQEVDFCICTRLHAAVLGICAGIPSVLLGYRDKCEDFALSVNMGDTYVDLSRADCLEAVDRVLDIMLDRKRRLDSLDISTCQVRNYSAKLKLKVEQIFG